MKNEEKYNETLKNSIKKFFYNYANYKNGFYSVDEKYKESVLDALSILVMKVSKDLES